MKKTLILVIIFISLVGLIIVLLTPQGWKANLVSPMGFTVRSTPVPTQAPPVTPKTFKFDSSTDLKTELDKVNPKVEDSDFN